MKRNQLTMATGALLEKFSIRKGSYASLLTRLLKEPNAKALCEQAIEEMKISYVDQPDLLEHMTTMFREKLQKHESRERLNKFKESKNPEAKVSKKSSKKSSKDFLIQQIQDFGKDVELHEDLLPHLTEDGKFPMLRHPLVYSVPHSKFLNDYLNKQYELKKKAVEEAKVSGNYSAFVFLHERPHRLNAFSEICEWLNDTDYYQLLASIWIDSENITQQRELWQKHLLARKVVKRHFMSQEDRKVFESLPSIIKVYRGYVPQHNHRFGFSYTLDRTKAEYFANRYSNGKAKGKVAIMKIAKEKVFAYTNQRNEQEIIILPSSPIHTLSQSMYRKKLNNK